jgi:Aromatic-ring-opening dioxygenase LigAB, LigA subunit
MSLYQLSKLLYALNRDEAMKQRFETNRAAVAEEWPLTEEEKCAFVAGDIGLLYVLGVNGQILMHFAALCGIAWADYLEMMREGVRRHGPVRAGVYALMSSPDERVVL